MDSIPDCPECGEEMIRRRNRKTDEQFWGCTYYPQCDGTRPIDSKPAHPGYPDWASDPANQ